MFQIDLKNRKPLYEQIVDNYKEQIINGLLKSDEKMPSVRDLAKELTINPNTIQKAYRELEYQGYIYSVKGRGTFISGDFTNSFDIEKANKLKDELKSISYELLFMGLPEKDLHEYFQEILSSWKGGKKQMIEVKNLSKSFNDTKVLSDLNLSVEKGSIYGLIGANGAGKTTLIKHITGVFQQDSGEVLVDEEPVFENQHAKSTIGYISDDLFFFTSYTLKSMAKYYSSIYKNWNQDRYNSMLRLFNLNEKKKINKFSKGMKKQAAFILTMSSMPTTLVLDEPIDGLDPLVRKKVWKVIVEDVAEREMSVLVSSHNLKEMEGICDSIGILSNGRMLLQRNLDELKSDICKIQIAFNAAQTSTVDLAEKLNILHEEDRGSIKLMIVKGNVGDTQSLLKGYNPLILDVLPLTLEEIFIYELGGEGYEIEGIVF